MSGYSTVICGIFFFKEITMCSPLIKQGESWDFPGPVIKNIPSRARGAGSIPGQEAKTPHTSGPKKQIRSSVILITNNKIFLKWFKMGVRGVKLPILERGVSSIY